MPRGHSASGRPKNAKKNIILGTQKSFHFPFSGLQRPKMTSWENILKNSFQNRYFLCFLRGSHFWPLEATKRVKPYSLDPKTLSLAVFWPPEAKYYLLTSNTKKSFQNQVFLCFMKRGHFWPQEATKCEKPYSGDSKILSFSFFRPPEAKNDLLT